MGEHLGFTGTRGGLTKEQYDTVEDIVRRTHCLVAVHGDCVGADAQFDAICARHLLTRHIRPCTIEELRAHCERRGAVEVSKPKAPMTRN